MTSRRAFVGWTLAAAGSIFVPKYDRWFRPNAIVPVSSWGKITTAVIYDAKGDIVLSAPCSLDRLGGISAFFPAHTFGPRNLTECKLLDPRGRAVADIPIETRHLTPGDTARLHIPNYSLAEREVYGGRFPARSLPFIRELTLK